MKSEVKEDRDEHTGRNVLLYGINDNPPWYLCMFLAVQQFLTCFSGILAYPIILSTAVCIAQDTAGLSEFINTVIFVSGVSTLLQTTFGTRLPIVQGPSYTYIPPILILMSQYKDGCPDFDLPGNNTLPFEKGSAEHKEVWKSNMAKVLFSIIISWLLCLALTLTNVLPDRPGEWGYMARTDTKTDALSNAEWFRFPYPGQWGAPRVSLSGVLGTMAGCVASMIESVGDYYACARLCDVTAPPASAICRGIGVEGITGLLAAVWGSGGGNSSYSQNIGAIGITKVGSRVVIQCVGVIMIVLGCLGKIGGFFVMVPTPIIGGLYFVTFGMVTAVGVSNLQLIDLNSTRNLFIFGFSMFFGMCVPRWIASHPLDVGNTTINQLLTVLAGTSMLTGGTLAFVLDNTISGTLEERGLIRWGIQESTTVSVSDESGYDLPFLRPLLKRVKCFRYLPFCPASTNDECHDDQKYTEMTSASDAIEKTKTPNDETISSHNNNSTTVEIVFS